MGEPVNHCCGSMSGVPCARRNVLVKGVSMPVSIVVSLTNCTLVYLLYPRVVSNYHSKWSHQYPNFSDGLKIILVCAFVVSNKYHLFIIPEESSFSLYI
jgi:hypothetical protein